MKKKKIIIIVAIVAAVAAFLVWRSQKGKEKGDDKGGNGTTGGGTTDPAPLTEEQIIARLTSCPESNKHHLTYYVDRIKDSPTLTASVQSKAAKNNTTFAKQCVMDASWLTYRTGANANSDWAARVHNRICAEVMAM